MFLLDFTFCGIRAVKTKNGAHLFTQNNLVRLQMFLILFICAYVFKELGIRWDLLKSLNKGKLYLNLLKGLTHVLSLPIFLRRG